MDKLNRTTNSIKNPTALFLFFVISLIIFIPNVYASPNVVKSKSVSSEPVSFIDIILIICAVIIIGVMSCGIIFATIRANKDYNMGIAYKNQLRQINKEEMEINKTIHGWTNVLEMECMMCKSKIDRPMNLIRHLGIEQTKRYLQFCDETQTKPTLYCCSCYPMVNRNPDWQKAFDDMVNNQIKTNEMRKLWEMKVQA